MADWGQSISTYRRHAAEELARRAGPGLTASELTGASALLCVIVFFYFWFGDYWSGLAAAVLFLFAGDVGEAVAASNPRSDLSTWGEQAIAIVHPPLWWWAWGHGLARHGTPLEPVYQTMLIAAIVIGYAVQLSVEALFRRRFGLQMRDWSRLDSQFRPISAAGDFSLLILFVALLFGRPDAGLELVALWTILSALFQMLRLAQAEMSAWRGQPPERWKA